MEIGWFQLLYDEEQTYIKLSTPGTSSWHVTSRWWSLVFTTISFIFCDFKLIVLRSSLQIANKIIILPVYPSMHFFHWQWSHIPLSILQSTGFRVSLLSCLKCKAGSGVGTHKRMLTNSPTFITVRIIPQMFFLWSEGQLHHWISAPEFQ